MNAFSSLFALLAEIKYLNCFTGFASGPIVPVLIGPGGAWSAISTAEDRRERLAAIDLAVN
jgi:hypothetical protein